MKLSHIARRNIFRNTRRSILSLIAIAVAAMTITFMFGMIEGIKDDVKTNAILYSSGQLRIRNAEYDRFEHLSPLHLAVHEGTRMAEALLDMSEVRAVSPRIGFGAGIFIDDDRHAVSALGVDFSFEAEYQDLNRALRTGRLPEPQQNEAAIGYALAERLGLEIGDTITMLAMTRTRGSNAFSFTITGLLAFPVDTMNAALVMMPLDRAQRFLWMGSSVSEILILLENRVSEAAGIEAIDAFLADMGLDELHVKAWDQIGITAGLVDYMETVYFFIALFFFILGSTVIVNTTMMTVYERGREIGTLGALGMGEGQMTRLFFLEAFFIGIAGSIAGVLLGSVVVGITSSIGIDYGEALDGMDMGISTIIYPILNFKSSAFVFFYSVCVASLAALIPCRKVAKIEPVEALRTT